MTARPHRTSPAASSDALAPLAVPASRAASLIGVSRSKFFELHACGKVPMPVYLGARAPRWRVAELSDWLDAGCPDRQTWDQMREEKARGRASP